MNKTLMKNRNCVDFTNFAIRIVGGSMRGIKFPVHNKLFTIGRFVDADIRIHDTFLAPIHCQLAYLNGSWHIEDLHSNNGIWISGRQISVRNILPLKTPVVIGKTIFEMEIGTQAESEFSGQNWFNCITV